MARTSITEKELMDARYYDLSIQTLPNGKDFLILVCKDRQTSAKLIDILRNNAFDLTVYVNEQTGNYSLNIDFIDSHIVSRFDTGKNEKLYPPLQKLNNGQLKFITSGVWTGNSSQGRTCEYDPKFMRLGSFDIGDAFTQATGVQFVSGNSENEPSLVVLTYTDYDHIFDAEADEAYNRLAEMAVSRPVLEINPVDAETVNLRIWDILIDMDIYIDGLKYSQEQLNDFLAKTDETLSFAFVIGFKPDGHQKAAIASTKKEGFELITLWGYTFRK